jgi:Peptidase family M23.
VISGQVGAEVKAAAAGTVSAVDTNAQTGTTVSIDMGNGYAAILPAW